jgi:site-specific DNA-methyltransferase (adenine-specific)
VSITILQGDCRTIMPGQGPFDCIIADPPYGETSLSWDKMVRGWERIAHDRLKPTGSMWVFGSLRFFMLAHRPMRRAGLRVTQEVVWEKHNGSGFHADRFKRVHELAVQVIRTDAAWADVYNDVQTTPDAVARKVRRKKCRLTHMGHINQAAYGSEDGGPLIMRSVIYARSCQGRAIHPTEKPVDLLEILLRTSCPPGGLVGDFFAGSGAAADAARGLGRRYVGCELNPDYHAAAQNRLGSMLPLGAAA